MNFPAPFRRIAITTAALLFSWQAGKAQDASAELPEADLAPPAFVLVHGAWGGGYEFAPVAELLRQKGYRVFTPTLTGLGDRVHLLSAETDLSTHIEDVANVFRFEGIERAVLLGHSYGGMVITGVADRIPDQIAAIVYLDAAVPVDGEALADLDLFDPDAANWVLEAQQAGLAAIPFPGGPALAGVPEDVIAKIVPHPTASLTEKIHLTGAGASVTDRTYVSATEFPAFHAYYEKMLNDPAWHTVQVATGHNIHVEAPERTAQILEDVLQRILP